MKKGSAIFMTVIATILLIGGAGFAFRAYKQANCEHEYGEGEVVKEATCTEDGLIEYECDECGKIKEEEIDATGHKVLQLDAVRATCTSTGLHAGEMCEVCEKVLVPQEEIPMLNHDLETVGGKLSTCTVMGHFEYEACKDCDYTTEIVYLPLEAHALETVTAQAATCTEDGWERYQVCTVCGTNFGYVEISATGHDYNSSELYRCDLCGEYQTWNITYKVDGEAVKTTEIRYDDDYYEPADPVKEGYRFVGWFYEGTDELLGSRYDAFLDKEDLVFEARFISLENEFTNNGQLIVSQYDTCAYEFVDGDTEEGLPDGYDGAVLKISDNGDGHKFVNVNLSSIKPADVQSIVVRCYFPGQESFDNFRIAESNVSGISDMSTTWCDITLDLTDSVLVTSAGTFRKTFWGLRDKGTISDYFYIDSITVIMKDTVD